MGKRKILPLILTAVMLCTCFPVSATAKTADSRAEKVANIVLFGYFSDTTAEEADAFFAENSAKIMKILDGSHGRSFKNYISSISYGKMQIENIFPQYSDGVIIPAQIGLTETFAGSNKCDERIVETLVNSIPDISDKTVDFDGDGIIDNVMIILKTSSGSSPSGSLVSHKGNYAGTLKINRKRVTVYNIIGSETLFLEESGVVAHEFLHTLGYPDLYRSSGNDLPVYLWSIMGAVNKYPQYPLAYERMYFTNWITIDEVTQSASLTLDVQSNPNGNQAFILKSPLNEREIFVIEYRVRPKRDYVNEDSLDYFIGGSGIIVYRVNLDVEGLSNLTGRTGIYVFRPQPGQVGSGDSETTAVYNAYLPYTDSSGTRNSIGSHDISKTLSDGALTFSDGSNSCIEINNIRLSADGTQAYCDVSIPKKEDYDIWNNLEFRNTAIAANNRVSFETVGDVIYSVSSENNKIYSQKYENGGWTEFASPMTCRYGDNFNVVRLGDYLYLSYDSDDNNYRHYMFLYRYDLNNGGSWQLLHTIDGVSYSGSRIGVVNGELYISYIGELDTGTFTNPIKVKRLSGDTLADVGICGNMLAGNPKIFEINGHLGVAFRNADNRIIVKEYYNGTFYDISDPNVTASVYDVVTCNGKVYFTLSDSELKIAVYDGTDWTINAFTGVSSAETAITENGGEIYVLSSPQDGNGSMKAYSYRDGEFTEIGESIDNSSQNISAEFIGSTLYCSYVRTGDNSIFFKSMAVEQSNLYDINGDGVTNSNDYAILREYVLFRASLTPEQKHIADVNKDGAVDGFDAIMLDVYLHSQP